jgi:hypothetical protein
MEVVNKWLAGLITKTMIVTPNSSVRIYAKRGSRIYVANAMTKSNRASDMNMFSGNGKGKYQHFAHACPVQI